MSDENYLQKVTTKAQEKIDGGREDAGDDYCADGMKMEILDWLDEIYIEMEGGLLKMGNDIESTKKFHLYLQKCTIEYVAKHGGGIPSVLKGLSAKEIEPCLREVGFRIKERVMADGTWVKTSSGISISLEDGFCVKA